jgi:uncharacterized membrane protein (TIGR01666 family)
MFRFLPRVSRRDLTYFFFSQHFSDGLRTTLAILLPALIGAQWGDFATGVTISTGAVCVSVADTPGSAKHKRNGMLATLVMVFGVAILTGLVAPYRWLLGLEIVGLAFALTMLLVWGARAGSVGSGALLAMVLMLAHPPTLTQVVPHALLLLLGGAWYLVLALLQQQLQPYRAAQQTLGECLHAMAGFLQLKATFYQESTDLADDYRRLVAQQILVNEKQEAVRDVLFRSRQLVSESTRASRRLVLTFVEAVDLYEHIMAGYYDYDALRKSFGNSGILADIAALITRLATDLDYLGSAIQANHAYGSPTPDRIAEWDRLQVRIAALPSDAATGTSTRVLKKILVNLRDLIKRISNLRRYFDEGLLDEAPPQASRAATHVQFVAPQQLYLRAFAENLTMSSAVFRHSVRMALACAVAFLLAEKLWHGQHNYWVLMTVTIMLKPGFSLTRQRNIERIIGTLVGGALGAVILRFVPGGDARFVFLVVFMVIAYSFLRTKYIVTVVFLTAYLLIMFTFLGAGYLGIIEERITDTLLGCAIAFSAGYLLFPSWESDQLRDLLAATLRANLAYLRQLADRLLGREVPDTAYRLRRKDVYVSSANLAAAFQRMLSEPKSKQRHPTEIHQFVVLNHILSSNIASLTTTLQEGGSTSLPSPESRRALTSALAALTRSLTRLAPEAATEEIMTQAALPEVRSEVPATPADRPLLDQLAFLQKVSTDLSKVTEVIVG